MSIVSTTGILQTKKDSEDPVLLDVIVGHGQPSLTNISINGQLVVSNVEGSFEDFDLGTNNDLRGKRISVNSLVHDLREETNRTSVSFTFTGGKKKLERKLNFTVPTHGDVVFYKLDVLCM